MSSRALRKAQREREEQAQLSQLDHDDSDDEYQPPPAKQSAFAVLGDVEDEDNDDDDDDVGVRLPVEELTAPEATTTSSKKNKKKSKKKKKNADKSAMPVPQASEDDGLDEIDKALKQLAANGDASQSGTTTAGIDEAADAANKLLSVDSTHLHAANEMRRLFGRTALEQQDVDQEQGPAGGNRRQNRRMQQMGLAQAIRARGEQGGRPGFATMALRRNLFIQGKEEWPVATAGGLAMEIEDKRADGTILYRFTHNTAYQSVQSQFQQCVESMDPNRLVVLLQHNPYHISTLLQVSEIAKQERDPATSGDLLERALFSFGRAVHSTFSKSIAEGKARLDFARPENREFFLTGWRYIQSLSLRATWRTVYEWTKLLLSLSPEEDPYALWFVLDQYALRAKQDLDYLNISRDKRSVSVHRSSPNVQISQALAEHRAGNPNKGKQALFTAVGRFPWVIARLMQELALDPPPLVWGKEPRTDKEKLYSELYATRAKDLWTAPEASALLIEVAAALPPDTPSASADTTDISRNEARHVLLCDVPALIAFVPRSYTNALMSSSDPLPPTDSITSYDLSSRPSYRSRPTETVSRADQMRELQSLTSWFARIMPWFREGEEMDEATTVENLERSMAESGISEEELAARSLRLMELKQALGLLGGDELESETEENGHAQPSDDE
ncbi:Hypothetical protein R9X50_00506300 [Acrodontium crateriforme]|uniref:DUF654-domain-containing protein n=1 Tax=Acrodontium crateriforme TaxID=150365 RepID=A0AAQ3M6Q8_9PEZI|nr:Hypothetical protein R9X50_00506300 [Acrodontium crateriforme]